MNQYFVSVDKSVDLGWYFENNLLTYFDHLQDLEKAIDYLEREGYAERVKYDDYTVIPKDKGIRFTKKRWGYQYLVLMSFLSKIKLDFLVKLIGEFFWVWYSPFKK